MTDDLLRVREQFPSLRDSVHFISHSLGAMPARAVEYLTAFTELWVKKSITAWEDWLPEVERAGERVGRLMNAAPGTVVMNTNVSAIQALLASCFDYTAARNEVVYTDMNFSTVSYVWKAEERRGARVVIVPTDGKVVDTEALCAAITERTVCVPISHVLFRSSFVQDVARIVKRAHEVGAVVILDTYQGLGTVPLDVQALGVDFVCGGSVKWLCGGPGAAYLYVRPDLIGKYAPRVTGWFGHEKPFAFTMPEQRYAGTIWRFMAGTPAVAALYQARAGAEIVAELGVEAIRKKSLAQTARIIERVRERGHTLTSPAEDERRGGSVVFDFDGAQAVAAELNRRRFFCDYRPGAGIRVSPHFYTKDEEIFLLFEEIKRIGKLTGPGSSAY
jgi:kynureninase